MWRSGMPIDYHSDVLRRPTVLHASDLCAQALHFPGNGPPNTHSRGYQSIGLLIVPTVGSMVGPAVAGTETPSADSRT